MSVIDKKTEGWTWLHNARKYHYFRGGRSLCKGWGLFMTPFEGFHEEVELSYKCAGCRGKLEEEQCKSN